MRERLSIGESESGAFELGSLQQERERIHAELEDLERQMELPTLRPDQLKELKGQIVLVRQQLKLLDINAKPEHLNPNKTIH